MINLQDAKRLVYNEINQPDRYWPDKPEMIILDDCTVETDYGWIFYWTSRPWYETDEFQYAIAGNGPILVSRETGMLFHCGTAPPIEDRIHEQEMRLNASLPEGKK